MRLSMSSSTSRKIAGALILCALICFALPMATQENGFGGGSLELESESFSGLRFLSMLVKGDRGDFNTSALVSCLASFSVGLVSFLLFLSPKNGLTLLAAILDLDSAVTLIRMALQCSERIGTHVKMGLGFCGAIVLFIGALVFGLIAFFLGRKGKEV